MLQDAYRYSHSCVKNCRDNRDQDLTLLLLILVVLKSIGCIYRISSLLVLLIGRAVHQKIFYISNRASFMPQTMNCIMPNGYSLLLFSFLLYYYLFTAYTLVPLLRKRVPTMIRSGFVFFQVFQYLLWFQQLGHCQITSSIL
jgi:hypothetical protein